MHTGGIGGIIWEVEGRGSGSKGVAYHTDSPIQVDLDWWVWYTPLPMNRTPPTSNTPANTQIILPVTGGRPLQYSRRRPWCPMVLVSVSTAGCIILAGDFVSFFITGIPSKRKFLWEGKCDIRAALSQSQLLEKWCSSSEKLKCLLSMKVDIRH